MCIGMANGYRTPKADVVEVVRCKNCKYAEWFDDVIIEYRHYFCSLHNHDAVDENDFCSKGAITND